MSYSRSASSLLFVLLVAAPASAEDRKTPVRPKVTEVATPAPAVQLSSSGQKVAIAVAALTKEKRTDATTVLSTATSVLGTATDADSLMLVMLEFQRLLHKEAAGDAITTRLLSAKLDRLKLDNAKIDAGMHEARDKASNLMESAMLQLVTGIIGGVTNIAGAIGSGGGSSASAATPWRGSDVAIAAATEQALITKLPATARAAVERQVDSVLERATKAWDEKTSVAAAIAAALAAEAELAPLDREDVLAYALCRAHRRAVDDLVAAIKAKKAGGGTSPKVPYHVALKRIRLTLVGLNLVAKPLSKKDP